MGAAGRDFHNFNVVFRDDPTASVVAFTATQIPDIAGRRYPPSLAGARYPEGIPIVAEAEQMPVDPVSEVPKGFDESQRDRPGGFSAETDIFDTWFTSSLTPQLGSHWRLDPERHARLFPADIRPQSHEIIRTWAFYTIAKAMLHEDSVPWRHVVISGWVLDPDRTKMSAMRVWGSA